MLLNIVLNFERFNMSNQADKKCPACHGHGELATSHRFRCDDCNGTGKVNQADYDRLLAEERKYNEIRDRHLSAYEYRAMGG